MAERPSLAVRLLAVAFGLGASLFLAEIAARILEGIPLWPPLAAEPYVDNAVLYREVEGLRFYELAPGVDQTIGAKRIRVRTNAQGLRASRDLVTPKPAGTFRVLVLGDSFTFGGKVDEPETLPARLERALAPRFPGRTVEVWNAGVPGYNTTQELAFLRERGLAWEPDLVLLAFYANDADPAVDLVPRKARLPLGLRRALKRSALFQLGYERAMELRARFVNRHRERTRDFATLALHDPGWVATRGALEGFHDLAQRGLPVVVVLWPVLDEIGADDPHAGKLDFVREDLAEIGLPVVDLYPHLARADRPSLWAAPHDRHPSSIAYAISAEAVMQRLQALHRIPAGG